MTPKDTTPVDPRSLMTDRNKFMPRSLHSPKSISRLAIYLAKTDDKVTGPTDAVRRACRILGVRDDYSETIDPTMRKAVELTRDGTK